MPQLRPQPMVAVFDVPASSRFYQAVLGVAGGHGGEEFEMLLADGELVMMLHQATVAHHHGQLHDPQQPNGNGVALWFDVNDFDDRVAAVRGWRRPGARCQRQPELRASRDLAARPRRVSRCPRRALV